MCLLDFSISRVLVNRIDREGTFSHCGSEIKQDEQQTLFLLELHKIANAIHA